MDFKPGKYRVKELLLHHVVLGLAMGEDGAGFGGWMMTRMAVALAVAHEIEVREVTEIPESDAITDGAWAGDTIGLTLNITKRRHFVSAELEGLVGADKIERHVSEFESSGMWYYPVSFVNKYFVDSESEGVRARSFREFAL